MKKKLTKKQKELLDFKYKYFQTILKLGLMEYFEIKE